MRKGFDYTGVVVVTICHDGLGNILMHKRTRNCRDEHDAWDCGGGGVKFGERFEGALKRELMEEYSTEPLGLELLGHREVHRTHEGEQTHWVAFDYKVLVDPTNVSIGEPEMMSEVDWFDKNSLPDPLHSQVAFTLDLYKDRL